MRPVWLPGRSATPAWFIGRTSTAAYDSDDPALLNQVNAGERGVDRLYNTIAELTAFGL